MTSLEEVKIEEDGTPHKKEINVQSIKEEGKNLMEKIALARKQKEESLQKNVGKREDLIGEAAKNQGFLDEARETVRGLDSLDQEDLDLLDEADRKRLEGLRQTVTDLEARGQELNRTIEVLESNEDVIGAVRKEAEGRNTENIAKEKREEFTKDLELLGKDLAGKLEAIIQKSDAVKKAEDEYYKVYDPFSSSISEKVYSLKSKEAEEIWEGAHRNQTPTGQEILQALKDIKSKFGLLQYSQKNIIDGLIHSNLHYGIDEAKTAWDNAKQEKSTAQATFEQEFKNGISRAWEYQNILNDITKKDGDELPRFLYYEAHDKRNGVSERGDRLFQTLNREGDYFDLQRKNPKNKIEGQKS